MPVEVVWAEDCRIWSVPYLGRQQLWSERQARPLQRTYEHVICIRACSRNSFRGDDLLLRLSIQAGQHGHSSQDPSRLAAKRAFPMCLFTVHSGLLTHCSFLKMVPAVVEVYLGTIQILSQ